MEIFVLILLSIITVILGFSTITYFFDYFQSNSGFDLFGAIACLVSFVIFFYITKGIYKDFRKRKKGKTQWSNIEKYKDWQIIIYFIVVSFFLKGAHLVKKEYWPEIVSYNCNVQGEEVIQHYDLSNNKIWYWDNKKTSFSLDEDKHFYVYQIKAIKEELKNKGITATEFRLNTQTNNYTIHIIKNGVKEEYLKGSCKKIAE